jgi:hypothetical protein
MRPVFYKIDNQVKMGTGLRQFIVNWEDRILRTIAERSA